MIDLHGLLGQPVLTAGDATLTLGQALVAAGMLLAALLLSLTLLMVRAARARAAAALEAAALARETEARMAGILQAQAEMQGRMGAIAEVFGARQAELNQTIGQRLDQLTGRIGQTMTEQTRSTHESLSRLQERLAVIDTAQANISALAGQVVQLQSILSNKQTRGAFGQARMEAIVADGLPAGAYSFQDTLSNGSRPDCLIRLPNGAPPLVIDAKFPLEAWNAIRAAREAEAGAEAQKAAAQAFRRDLDVHVRAIAEKYLIAGETHDTAFMFVPSESIFAEIHEGFEAIVQRAHRARIVIVSPSLMMLSIQLIQSILKDASMREQAHLIQDEVSRLMEDVGRLDERVRKLQSHFGQASRDVEEILVSSSKVTRRGRRIADMELADGAEKAGPERVGQETAGPAQAVSGSTGPLVALPRGSAESRTGQLRLRIADEQG